MSTDFGLYLESLATLDDGELDHAVSQLARTERESMAQLIAHLAEMRERKIHLTLGYPSLFEYAVERLGLRPGSVWLRLQVASVARRFPQVLARLAEGTLSLSVAGHLSARLTAENLEVLFRDCAGMSTRQVKAYLARLQPKPLATPAIRKRPQPKPAAPAGDGAPGHENAASPLPSADAPSEVSPRAEAEAEAEAPPPPAPFPSIPPAPAATPPAPGRLDPAGADTYNVRFGAERALIEKLERFGAVAGFRNPVRDIARIIERALDVALEVKDPARREARRRRRAEQRAARAARTARTACEEGVCAKEAPAGAPPEEGTPRSASDPRPESPRAHEAHGAHEAKTAAPAPSRTIPRAMRDRVLARAGHQCEFTSADGRRCTARAALEIEHEEPFAIFGRHDESRMRAFCRAHNQLRAEEVYGAEFIQRKIEARRREAKRSRVAVDGEPTGRRSPAASVRR